jgi:hypothetical protein
MIVVHDRALLTRIRAIPEFLDAAPYYLENPPQNAFLIGFAGASHHALRDLARKLLERN